MAAAANEVPTAAQLEQVKAAVRALLKQPEYDDGSAGPVLVRLAWHAAGTYDKATNTGGSNGAGMRYEQEGGDPANAGLQHARAFLEPVKKQFPFITYADLWTLAAVVAIEAMGGPVVPWAGGRTDFADDTRLPPRGRLPDGAQGADHLRHVFYRMGFNDQEIVALSGAHNLGRCHADRSGFAGKWVPNPTRFSNQYFGLLLRLEREWRRTTLPNGVEQFTYVDEDAVDEDDEDAGAGREAATLMMLPTDMSLLGDAGFRPWVERYAADKALFFADFAAVFAKLLELGLDRAADGRVLPRRGGEDEDADAPAPGRGYRPAPKKSDVATAVQRPAGPEAEPLARENDKFRQRKDGAKL